MSKNSWKNLILVTEHQRGGYQKKKCFFDGSLGEYEQAKGSAAILADPGRREIELVFQFDGTYEVFGDLQAGVSGVELMTNELIINLFCD